MILSDASLHAMLPTLLFPHDPALVNPASVDIRVGDQILLETGPEQMTRVSLADQESVVLVPGAFALVPTYERLVIPNGYAVELKLKSSTARKGFDHSLAFWFDPGWDGIGTMEIRNGTRYTPLRLFYMMRFGQIIVHQLDRPAEKPYVGRYQYASGVEAAKPELP